MEHLVSELHNMKNYEYEEGRVRWTQHIVKVPVMKRLCEKVDCGWRNGHYSRIVLKRPHTVLLSRSF